MQERIFIKNISRLQIYDNVKKYKLTYGVFNGSKRIQTTTNMNILEERKVVGSALCLDCKVPLVKVLFPNFSTLFEINANFVHDLGCIKL